MPYGTNLTLIGPQLVEALGLEGTSFEIAPKVYGDVPASFQMVICVLAAFIVIWLLAFTNEITTSSVLDEMWLVVSSLLETIHPGCALCNTLPSLSKPLESVLDEMRLIISVLLEPMHPGCALCSTLPSLSNLYGLLPEVGVSIVLSA